LLFSFFQPEADADIQAAKTLLTMGFQRETAARGSLVMFTSVRHPRFVVLPSWAHDWTVIGCICDCARVHRFSHNAHSPLYRRCDHNHQHGHLCFRNFSPFISIRRVLMPHQLTKQIASRRPDTDFGVERGSLSTPDAARDDDREAR
jgi:hypothetical protein